MMIVTNSVNNDKIKRGAFKRAATSLIKMFKELEEQMVKDSNFMMEVNQATTRNIGK